MATSGPRGSQPPLADSILQYGKLAFDPELSEETRRIDQKRFTDLIESTGTLALMPTLNLLVQPNRVQPWLRMPLIRTLALLPLRPRGVLDTIEFILSVHPSSSLASASTGKGSNISHEALNAVSRLLSSPPTGMSPDLWFSGIAPQLLSLLDGAGEPEMDKAACYVIGFGILGRRQYGAPGMPGWKAFVEPILRCIDPSTDVDGIQIDKNQISCDETITVMRGEKIVVSSHEIAKALSRLTSLVTFHPHPSLTRRILGHTFLPLWALSSWPNADADCEKNYRKPARDLLKSFLQLSSSGRQSTEKLPEDPSREDPLTKIVRNLLFKGRCDQGRLCWEYASAKDGSIQIQNQPYRDDSPSSTPGFDFDSISHAANKFVELLQSMPDLEGVSVLFLNLCTKWLADTENSVTPSIVTRIQPTDGDDGQHRLIEAKIMQEMITALPERLVSDSKQVLDLVNQVLHRFNADGSENSNEDAVTVALSLLNIVLTSASSRAEPQTKSLLDSIQASLYSISKRNLDISSTAQNLLLFLSFRDTINEPTSTSSSAPTDQELEDRKAYALAISYLTATGAPPPVQVQGLDILSKLIQKNSPILDIPALLVLFSSLLQDNEEYLYLRVIQSFLHLSSIHPRSVMRDLVERYVDTNEESGLDARLRLGEALLQVISRSSSSFTGELAHFVCNGLLSIAGRRGRRPKSEEEQQKQKGIKRKKDKEAEEAWGGEVPQLEEVLGTDSIQENEAISRIVFGWESNHGSEDVRMRTSALSILGSAIETNVAGVGSQVVAAAVDLSIHVITLETEPEKAILRSSAILLVMSLARALNLARGEGRKVGFGFAGTSLDDILRVLQYVEDTDNNDLVRQHSRDVIESLQSWQMNSMLPSNRAEMDIGELAGLSITPQNVGDRSGMSRPRIEEIE